MINRNRNRRSSLTLVFMAGAILLLIVLAVALGGGGGGSPINNRANPENVNERVINALKSNDQPGLYQELSPSLKNLIPPENMEASKPAANNPATIQILEAPQIKTVTPWNGEWADARLRITRNNGSEEYIARYRLENGEWWLYATLKVK